MIQALYSFRDWKWSGVFCQQHVSSVAFDKFCYRLEQCLNSIECSKLEQNKSEQR